MRDLIFVVKNDGTYEQVPNKNLRSQENYSDNFVVIANRVGVVKAKIKLLSRTDRVEVKYLVPSLESVSDLIGDKPYFQDYASASVWRGAVPKKLLQEISMSYAGQIEVSFSFLKPVLDSRATNYKGDILTGDTLPETATNGDYYVIKVATYTIGEIVLKYGQTAIWDGAWVKGGTYQVIGTTTTQKMNVEPTLIGEEAEFDIDEADEIHEALEEHALTLSDHEQRILTNATDIQDIVNGELPAEKANKATGDEYGNRISTTYATQNTLDDALNQIENTGEIIAKKAELDDDGNTIKRTYLNKLNKIKIVPSASRVSVLVEATRPAGNFQNPPFSSVSEDIPASTTMNAGVMSATDKSRLDQLWAVLQDSSDPTFVDTINEILAIFANYPDGMDIIAKFAEKADKTYVDAQDALKAALAVSNVFTQPQQVPNATLPQHTTNLSQVETMFEMLKQQLRGYNLASPDLTGKEYLGNGEYRVYLRSNGFSIYYNVFTGIYTFDGESQNGYSVSLSNGTFDSNYYYSSTIQKLNENYSNYSYNYIQLSGNDSSGFLYLNNDVIKNTKVEGQIGRDDRKIISIAFNNSVTYDRFQFKLQIEKGDTATDYKVPGQIPDLLLRTDVNDTIIQEVDAHKNDFTPHKLQDLENSRELLWGFEIDINGVLNFVLKEIE